MSTFGEPLFDYAAVRRDQVREALGQALAAESDVAFSFVHGSFVTEGPFHDIDVAVYFVGLSDLEMSRRTFDLASSLEEVVFADLRIRRHPPIDVRALNAAPLGFRYQVLRTG